MRVANWLREKLFEVRVIGQILVVCFSPLRAIVVPECTTTKKYPSKSKIVSGVIEVTSNIVGCGGPFMEYIVNVG